MSTAVFPSLMRMTIPRVSVSAAKELASKMV